MAGVRETWDRVRRQVGSIAASLRDRFSEGRIPNWLLGAFLALVTWRTAWGQPSADLDGSWNTGLYMALKQGLQFGEEVVFTYGPLGFLSVPSVAYQDLAVIAFVWSAALYLGLAISVVWALRRTLSTGTAVVAAFLALALLSLIELPVALVAILGLGMLQLDKPPVSANAFVLIAGSLAAIESLDKIAIGPTVLAIALIALIGARGGWWRIGGLIGLFVAEFLLLWTVTGQSISNIPAYIGNSEQIVSGYNEAMASRETSSLVTLVEVLAPFAVVVASAAGQYRDRFARLAAIVLVGLTSFLLFKQGVVRFVPYHVAIWVSTSCLLWIAIPWPASRRAALLWGAAVLGILAVHVAPPAGTRVDPIENFNVAREQLEELVRPGQRAEREDLARYFMKQTYRLDRETRNLLRGHSVSIDPWEIGVAWAYDLEWSPLPVFQNYSAYTEHLDELNADEIENPSGPERILRQNTPPETFPTGSIDSRFPGWDPPAQARATLCHFKPLRTTPYWQVLARTGDRCGEPRQVRTVESSFGEVVAVPAPGPSEVVFARIHGVAIGGVERLRAFFWRPRSRYAVVNGSTVYRVVPDTAAEGLMLRAAPGVTGRGRFSAVPQARTVMLTGVSGGLRYEFFRLPVRPAGVR